MALFSDDLFNVFEEEPDKTTKAKKRKRVDDGKSATVQTPGLDEQKKAKVGDTILPTSSLPKAMEEEEPLLEGEEMNNKET